MNEDTEFADVTSWLQKYQPAAPTPEGVARIAAALTPRPSLVRRWAPIAAAALLILALGTAWMWRKPALDRSTLVSTSMTSDEIATFKTEWFKRTRVSLPFEIQDRGVTIVVFVDWLCPPCFVLEGDLRAVLAPLEELFPGRVRLIYVDWPWDSTCNPTLAAGGSAHPGACYLASAVHRARANGREQVLIDWLRNHQRDWRAVGLPTEFVIPTSAAPDPIVQDGIAKGKALGVTGTPTMFINGVRIDTRLSRQHLDQAIRLELDRPIYAPKR